MPPNYGFVPDQSEASSFPPRWDWLSLSNTSCNDKVYYNVYNTTCYINLHVRPGNTEVWSRYGFFCCSVKSCGAVGSGLRSNKGVFSHDRESGSELVRSHEPDLERSVFRGLS